MSLHVEKYLVSVILCKSVASMRLETELSCSIIVPLQSSYLDAELLLLFTQVLQGRNSLLPAECQRVSSVMRCVRQSDTAAKQNQI